MGEAREDVTAAAGIMKLASPTLVVGVGASAGGLDACKRLLSNAPSDLGIAFILVFHLAPRHESHIAEILRESTTLNVVQVTQSMRVEPNRVHVIEPNESLRIRNGTLFTESPADEHGVRTLIDTFFKSLAADQREHAAGIVLSGTGSDGANGMREIAREGGLCLAQEPETAEYDSMPKSAIDTGAVHHVLPPEEMHQVLVERAEAPPRKPERGPVAPAEPFPKDAFAAILGLLGARHGLDFRAYKKGTLRRRTERRMGLQRIHDWGTYAQYLHDHPEELSALYDDLFIGVTRFFRDPEVWTLLGEKVIPDALEEAGERDPALVKVWVPGCATGEEAYSLAILFLEALEDPSALHPRPRVQIYATDVDADALASARQGLYATDIEADISPERLRRFFRPEGTGFRVAASVRERVTFAAHDVLSDPPFSNLDLLSCRNLLIYLEPFAQDRLLEMFHYALRRSGKLLLGRSETVGRRAELFEPVSKKGRLYRALEVPRRRLPVAERMPEPTRVQRAPHSAAARPTGANIARRIEQRVLARHTSACVVLNERFEILFFFGPTENYLTRPTGEARMDLLAWARPGLYAELRGALEKAVSSEGPVTATGLRIEHDGRIRRVDCAIEPFTPLPGAERLLLVAFGDVPETKGTMVPVKQSEAPLVRQLEEELKSARAELQDVIEQLESADEEYRASHEELLSINEELQSANEELESSKEELQSLNEETLTINRELEEKNASLRALNTDVNNFLTSTRVPTIFLDRELRIRRFTPSAEALMHLVPSDVGRSIEHVKERFSGTEILADAAKVLEKLIPIEKEVSTGDGDWFALRVLPYRTEDDRIDGVCITFGDITAQKKAAADLAQAKDYAEGIIRTIRTALLVLDGTLRVVSANESFYRLFQVSPGETNGRELYELGNRQWDIPALRKLLEEVLPRAKEIRDYEFRHDFDHLGRRDMLLNAREITRDDRLHRGLILLSIEDISNRVRAEELARQRAEALLEEHHRKDEFLAMLGHELRNPLSALANGLELLRTNRTEPSRVDQVRAMMTRQTTRIATMLDQILDLARVISGKIEIARVPVDWVSVIQAAIETMTPQLSAAGHELTVSLPPEGVVYVRGDAIRLGQIVENLLGNAIRYMDPHGRIWLTLEADAAFATLTVKDAGLGIDAELLPHVFDLFTQARRAPSRSKGGLGLGLSLTRRLAEMHGGEVEAQSEGLGRGSTFRVALPRLAEQDAGRALPVEGAKPEVAPRRVLVVDDEPDAASSLAEILETMGHQSLAVQDGPGALEAARTFHPDVVLLDLGLPNMDGYEIARRLREEHGRGMVLVALSGYQRDPERLKRTGFDRHMLKPADLHALIALLAEPSPEPARE